MKCTVFIATSLDGFIATPDGGVDWLDQVGDQSADLGQDADMGFVALMESVDCLIMGRKCMEKVASFNLTDEQWPYGNTRVIALSNSLSDVPDSVKGKVELMSGDIPTIIGRLESEGHKHAYVDGGALISSFLNLKLINELIITQAPVVLGDGIPLFQNIQQRITFKNASATAYSNGFIQIRYEACYP
jgi:dihydrofolate reductase